MTKAPTARRKKEGSLKAGPFRIANIRMVTLNANAKPDQSFFDPEPLTPNLTFSVSDVTLSKKGTTLLFITEATLPFTGEEKKKGNAWSLSAIFFIYITHKPRPIEEVADFIRKVAAPMINMRFMGVVEQLATLAGINIGPVASTGMSIYELDRIDITEELAEAEEDKS